MLRLSSALLHVLHSFNFRQVNNHGVIVVDFAEVIEISRDRGGTAQGNATTDEIEVNIFAITRKELLRK